MAGFIVTLYVADPWQYYVCYTRSDVTQCTYSVVLYLRRMCQRESHVRGALGAHRYTFAPPRCRTSPYCRTFIPLSVSLWNDLADPVFDGVGLAGFTSRAYALLLAQLLLSISYLLLFSLSLLSFYRLVLCGWGLRTDRALITLSQPCIASLF